MSPSVYKDEEHFDNDTARTGASNAKRDAKVDAKYLAYSVPNKNVNNISREEQDQRLRSSKVAKGRAGDGRRS